MEVFKIYGDQNYWSISYEDNLDLNIQEKLDTPKMQYHI